MRDKLVWHGVTERKGAIALRSVPLEDAGVHFDPAYDVRQMDDEADVFSLSVVGRADGGSILPASLKVLLFPLGAEGVGVADLLESGAHSPAATGEVAVDGVGVYRVLVSGLEPGASYVGVILAAFGD